MQTGRNGLMKSLKGKMHDQTIMLSRFLFSLPIVLIWLLGLYLLGYEFPEFNREFFFYATIGCLFQIIASMLYLLLFGRRNFVIGVTYNQTQVIMTVIFSALFFAHYVSLGALIAIILSFVGVVMITVAEKHIEPKRLWQKILTPSAFIGIGCGVFFGINGVLVHKAISVLEGGDFFVNGSVTLLYVILLQAPIMFLLVAIRDKKQLFVMMQNRPRVYLVGLANAISSLGWFSAFSLTHSSHVFMLAQVEIIFSILLSNKVFKETTSKLEFAGMAIVVGSIIILVLYK
jgi:drug/metabolite transporter (DMT)-like permease